MLPATYWIVLLTCPVGESWYVIVMPQYEGDIIVITRFRGGAKDDCNNNDIIQVYGNNYFMSQCVGVRDNVRRFTDSYNFFKFLSLLSQFRLNFVKNQLCNY